MRDKIKIILILTYIAVMIVVGVGMEIYSLMGPEEYIQVRRLEWVLGGVALLVLAIVVAGAIGIDKFNAWRRSKQVVRERQQPREPQLPRSPRGMYDRANPKPLLQRMLDWRQRKR